MKHIDWEKVQEASGGKLPAGGYVCGITAVEDDAEREFLKFEFDIAEGEYKNTYRELYETRGFWAGRFNKSYKEKALGYFKKMLKAFEKSNKGFVFTDDEKAFKRRLIGLVIGYEEYIGSDGAVKERIRVADFLPVEYIRAGRHTVPELKRLDGGKANTLAAAPETDDISDDDLPF